MTEVGLWTGETTGLVGPYRQLRGNQVFRAFSVLQAEVVALNLSSFILKEMNRKRSAKGILVVKEH